MPISKRAAKMRESPQESREGACPYCRYTTQFPASSVHQADRRKPSDLRGDTQRQGHAPKITVWRRRSMMSVGRVCRRLEYKARWYGRTLVKIDRWYPSSKTCSACGYVLDMLTLDRREWVCPKCEVCHDRDSNAARNVLTEGLSALNACGGTVRPAGPRGRQARRSKQETSIVKWGIPCLSRHGEEARYHRDEGLRKAICLGSYPSCRDIGRDIVPCRRGTDSMQKG